MVEWVEAPVAVPPGPGPGALESPPALRAGRGDHRRGRALAGAGLVIVAALLGARVVAAARAQTPVLVAARGLPAGHVLVPGDLAVAQVHLPAAELAGYWPGPDAPGLLGHVLLVPVSAGLLIGRDAVSAGAAAQPERLVSLPVDPGRLAELAPGGLVDVYATYKQSGAAAPVTELVVQGAEFLGTGGSTVAGDVAVRLQVPPSVVEALVMASELASLDVVAEEPAGTDTGQGPTAPLTAPPGSGRQP